MQSVFDLYLRTGLRPAGGVEHKFNPWHDAEDGRFTFVGQGRYFGRGVATLGDGGTVGDKPLAESGETGMARRPPETRVPPRARTRRRVETAPAPSILDPRHPENYSLYVVKAGDSLTSIARKRKGLRASDLAWLNDVAIDRPIRIGQQLKLPTQRSLEAGREAKNRALALAFYMESNGGRLPPNVANPPTIIAQIYGAGSREVISNGYRYVIDGKGRTRFVQGTIVLAPENRRAPAAQTGAGGPDRRPNDHGGHYIARRLNGPPFGFNHFAQNQNFNQSGYAKLEKLWERKTRLGIRVDVSITSFYNDPSMRPYAILVGSNIGGIKSDKYFTNESGKR